MLPTPADQHEVPRVAGQGLPAAVPAGSRRRNHQWQLATGPLARPLTLVGPVAAPMEWVEPVLVG